MRKNEEIITKIAMRKANIKDLYDKELEKRIVRAIKEKQSKSIEIKRMKDILEFLSNFIGIR